jgi:hypothetical protein
MRTWTNRRLTRCISFAIPLPDSFRGILAVSDEDGKRYIVSFTNTAHHHARVAYEGNSGIVTETSLLVALPELASSLRMGL